MPLRVSQVPLSFQWRASALGVLLLWASDPAILRGQTTENLANSGATNIVVNNPSLARAKSAKPIKCPSRDPNLEAHILNGASFLKALRPDKALDVCGAALKASCGVAFKGSNDLRTDRVRAESCVIRAEQMRQDLAAVDLQLKRLDKAVQSGEAITATATIKDLNQWRPSYADDPAAPEKTDIPDRLRDYARNSTKAHWRANLIPPAAQAQIPPVGFWSRLWDSLTDACYALPSKPPSVSQLPKLLLGLLEILGYSIAVLAVVCLILRWLGCRVFRDSWRGLKRLLARKFPSAGWLKPWRRTPLKWKILSIDDKSKAGAAGAIMEALDIDANPLIAPFVQEDKRLREKARARRHLLLAPPFLDEHPDPSHDGSRHPLRHVVLKDYPVYGPVDLLGIETLPFGDKETTPTFNLDELTYEEVDASIGGFQMKGLMGLWRTYKRWKDKYKPQVLGVVTRDETPETETEWTVRLNCDDRTGRQRDALIASVYADSMFASEYGDTLGTVAQRAGLKLVLRIANHRAYHLQTEAEKKANDAVRLYTTNQIHAIALYRQGVQTLLQIL